MRHRRYDGRQYDGAMVHRRNNRNGFLLASAKAQPYSAERRTMDYEYIQLGGLLAVGHLFVGSWWRATSRFPRFSQVAQIFTPKFVQLAQPIFARNPLTFYRLCDIL